MIKILPASWVCCSFRDFCCTLKRFTCVSSHSFRLRCSQSCNLISCIEVMNSYVLLLLMACCSKSS
ncbi:Uncharacterised protein [Segatella copri]|nr:Uncharacterised protein [Segatella copri]